MGVLKKKNKILKSKSWYWVFGLVIFFVGSNMALAEWQEPGSPPPIEDFYAPITITSEPQAKEGYLLIDPVNYHPSDDSSLNFSINKPLVVYGEGAKFSTNTVYDDILLVDTDTLYADAFIGWVGIGTTSQIADENMSIVGQTFQIGTAENPISGRALSSYSSDDYGIYVNAGATGNAGIYGLNKNNTSRAIYGESMGNNVGVRGESVDGVGIYAATDSSNFGAVYGNNDSSGLAGYFNGRVNTVSDIVSDVFLPAGLQRSLIPYTSGQFISSFPVPTTNTAIAFDGTYFYLGSGSPISYHGTSNNFFIIDSRDGSIKKRLRAPGWGLEDMEYDGKYIVMLNNYGDIVRYDPATDIFDTLEGDYTGLYTASEPYQYPQYADPFAIGTINGETYLWAPNEDHNYVIRVKISELSNGNATDFDIINLDDPLVIPNNPGITRPYGVVFDGKYIWVAQYGTGNISRIWGDLDDPNGYADHPGMVIDTTIGSLNCIPRDVDFDGTYIWCMTGTVNGERLVRIWAEDPLDPQHPAISVGGEINKLLGMTFDGTYNWSASHLAAPDGGLYRSLASDPTQFENIDPALRSYKVFFDGTYLWALDEPTSSIRKYYSGTGLGNENLGSVVLLDKTYGYCSVTTTQQCRYDWQCPVAETCDAGNTAQSGDFYLEGNAEVKKDHCYALGTHHYNRPCTPATVAADCSGLTSPTCMGGDIKLEGDLQTPNNLWGGICEDGITSCTTNADCAVACYGGTVPVDGSGNASCDDGDFMGGVELDANSEIVNIYCWEL